MSRYRIDPSQISSTEALSDTALALTSQYKSPMQAYQAACSGHGILTKTRLKTFIRSLRLRLDASIIESLTSSSSSSSDGQGDYVSFVDFLRLLQFDSAADSLAFAAAAPATPALRSSDAGVSLTVLEDALRERMRAAYGTITF